MLQQYNPQRFYQRFLRNKPVRVGTIPVGEIIYIQDGCRPFGRSQYADTVKRAPWIIEAWLPREVGAARKINGKYANSFRAGGHLAQVRCLRTNRRKIVADWILHQSIDLTE